MEQIDGFQYARSFVKYGYRNGRHEFTVEIYSTFEIPTQDYRYFVYAYIYENELIELVLKNKELLSFHRGITYENITRNGDGKRVLKIGDHYNYLGDAEIFNKKEVHPVIIADAKFLYDQIHAL